MKAEPSVDGVREHGVQIQAVTPSPNPAGTSGNSIDVKPSVADSIQTSGAYCSREENLKKEVRSCPLFIISRGDACNTFYWSL